MLSSSSLTPLKEDKRRTTTQLLVRSLSDSAKYNKVGNKGHNKEDYKAMTLTGCSVNSKAASDSKLYKSADNLVLDHPGQDKTLGASSAQNDCGCSCGCQEDNPVASGSDYSDDEGCYLVTNSTVSRESPGSEQTSASVTDQLPQVKLVSPSSSPKPDGNNNQGSRQGCIYINARSLYGSPSVDSGRSSDTMGTQSSTSSGDSCSRSSPHHGVHIVPHSYCDYLGSIKNKQDISPMSTGSCSSYASLSHSCQRRRGSNNKVTVYVPYSTLIALSNVRETPVDSTEEDDEEADDAKSSNAFKKAVNDNVVICDTQVILRINQPPVTEQEEEDDAYSKQIKKKQPIHMQMGGGPPKVYSKRMTKRLFNDETWLPQNTGSITLGTDDGGDNTTTTDPLCAQHIHKSDVSSAMMPVIPRRKDLCRLLGLNEKDVDLMIVPEVRVAAQKVALTHSTDANKSQQPVEKAKKKNLAKFLGVEPEDQVHTNKAPCSEEDTIAFVDDTSVLDGSSVTSGSESSKRPKSLLLNWGHMVKTSMKGWREEVNSDMEMDVPVQLRQMASNEPERTHRKDLSEFLGFDQDSDSEEIVFIRNNTTSPTAAATTAATGPQMYQSHNNSLTKSSSDCFSQDGASSSGSGSLRSFDSFVRRSLRCGASNEFASIAREAAQQQQQQPQRGSTVLSRDSRRKRKKDAERRIAEVTGGNSDPSLETLLRQVSSNHVEEPEFEFDESADTITTASSIVTVRTNPGIHSNNGQKASSNVTLDRRPPSRMGMAPIRPALRSQQGGKGLTRGSVVFGANTRTRMISPIRRPGKAKQLQQQPQQVFRREETLYQDMFHHPYRPMYYAHQPYAYAVPNYGPMVPTGGRMAVNPNSGRVRVVRPTRRPQSHQIHSGHPDHVDMKEIRKQSVVPVVS